MKRYKITGACLLLLLAFRLPPCLADVVKSTNNKIDNDFIPPSGTVPIVAGMDNKITVYGDWLDITNGIRMTIDGNTTEIKNYTTGRTPTWISFTVNTTSTGTGKIVMSRPGGQDEIKISVFDDVVIAEAKVLSANTQNIAYEYSFKVSTDFLVRVRGTNVNSLQFKTVGTLSSTGVRGTPTSQEIVFVCRKTNTTDKVEIKENFFNINIPGSSELGYHQLKTHTMNNNAFDFFRIYDKANFAITEVTNKFKRPENNQTSCRILIDSSRGIVNNINVANPEQIIKLFSLANPTSSSPQTQKTVTWPDISITLKNTSYAPVPAFTAVVKFGITELGTVSFPAMIAQSTATVSFRRPTESRKILARSITCPDVYELILSPCDWVDPVFTLLLDPQNRVDAIGYVRQFNF